jgi:DNA-binding protein HU-beta
MVVARKLVDVLFMAIAEAAAHGEEIGLNGFGKFKVTDTSACEGRNPATGRPSRLLRRRS